MWQSARRRNRQTPDSPHGSEGYDIWECRGHINYLDLQAHRLGVRLLPEGPYPAIPLHKDQRVTRPVQNLLSMLRHSAEQGAGDIGNHERYGERSLGAQALGNSIWRVPEVLHHAVDALAHPRADGSIPIDDPGHGADSALSRSGHITDGWSISHGVEQSYRVRAPRSKMNLRFEPAAGLGPSVRSGPIP